MGAAAPPELPAFVAAQLPGVRRAVVGVEGHAVHVMEWGDPAGVPVLMLHGNPSWGFLYRKVAAALLDAGSAPGAPHAPSGARWRLVAPDLVGLGFSDHPEDPAVHTLENHARWMGAAVDALALRDAIVVLQDWGGPIGLRLLADRPGLARGLVILNTVAGPPRPTSRPALFHRFAQWPVVSELAFRTLGLPERLMGLVQGDRSSIRGPVAAAYRWPLRHRRLRAAPLALARMVPHPRDPLHPSVAPLQRGHDFVTSFGGPIEVVWGTRDPVLGRVVHRIEKMLPGARLTRTGAGHFLQEEVPGEIAAAVRRLGDA